MTVATNSHSRESISLYALTQAYDEALAWLDEPENEAALEAAGGEIPMELAARLDAIEDQLDTKIERVALMIRTLEARSEVAASEAKRLQKLAASYGGRASSLKQYLLDSMRKTGRRKVDGELARVSLVTNPPSIRAADPSRIPADFALVEISERMPVVAWELITRTLEKAGVAAPEGHVRLDAREALRTLKDRGEIPTEPGRYEIGPFVVERGVRVQIR